MNESKTPRHDALRILATERPLEFKQLEVWAALAETENDLADARAKIVEIDDENGTLKAKLIAARAEVERLRKDAERYRWLKAHTSLTDMNRFVYRMGAETLDEAIDKDLRAIDASISAKEPT